MWKNREGIPEYAVRWNWVEDSSDSGFTAVLRVKDEARSLPFSLPGVLRCVEQAIVVDNGSSDGTPEVALGVAEELGFGQRMRVLSYPFSVSQLWTGAPVDLPRFGAQPDLLLQLVVFARPDALCAEVGRGHGVDAGGGAGVARSVLAAPGYRRGDHDAARSCLRGERARSLRRHRTWESRAVGLAELAGLHVL